VRNGTAFFAELALFIGAAPAFNTDNHPTRAAFLFLAVLQTIPVLFILKCFMHSSRAHRSLRTFSRSSSIFFGV